MYIYFFFQNLLYPLPRPQSNGAQTWCTCVRVAGASFLCVRTHTHTHTHRHTCVPLRNTHLHWHTYTRTHTQTHNTHTHTYSRWRRRQNSRPSVNQRPEARRPPTLYGMHTAATDSLPTGAPPRQQYSHRRRARGLGSPTETWQFDKSKESRRRVYVRDPATPRAPDGPGEERSRDVAVSPVADKHAPRSWTIE